MSATRLGVTLVWVLAVSTAVGLFTLSSADDKREVAPTTAAATAPAATPAGQVRARATQDGVSAYFSPHGGCTEAVVEQIAQARKTLRVQAYYLTSAPIAKAIADARGRGVDVTVLLDKSQQTAKYSSATFLLNAGVATYIDHRHATAHNKIILIDGHVVVTGSFNFTKAAEESNAENLLVIHDKADLYAAYEQNFQEHLEHSDKYAGPVQKTPARSRLPQAPATQSAVQVGNVRPERHRSLKRGFGNFGRKIGLPSLLREKPEKTAKPTIQATHRI